MGYTIVWSLVYDRCPECGTTTCPRVERMRAERERILAALDEMELDVTPVPMAVGLPTS